MATPVKGDDLAHAEERLLACERLAEELKCSLARGEHGPLLIHFKARQARLEREIETWRWYRASLLSRRGSSARN